MSFSPKFMNVQCSCCISLAEITVFNAIENNSFGVGRYICVNLIELLLII